MVIGEKWCIHHLIPETSDSIGSFIVLLITTS
jgi:hypothetical protein